MTKFEIVVGNIADIQADAIVNAANTELRSGGGVCGAIFAKAGSGLAQEIAAEHHSGCETGDAVTTSAYGLDAKYIIHAVAPVYLPISGIDHLLKSAYKSVFREARFFGVKTIALPSLGTGIYGWDLQQATVLAKSAILEGVRDYPTLEKVIFSCYSDEAAKVYEQLFSTELLYGLDFVPRCPKCGIPAVPIFYGLPIENDFDDLNFYAGGCSIAPGQANWACRDCEIEFA